MADMKQLRTRIKSVDSTLHLTKAMGLVASSKIRRAGIAMANAKTYLDAIDGIMANLTSSVECASSPFLQNRGNRSLLIVIAGDRGLAGGYNANVFRLLRELEYDSTIAIGKRAFERLGGEFLSSEHFDAKCAFDMATRVINDYLDGEYDKVGIIYTEYVSMMTQTATLKWILPLQKTNESNSATIFEPDRETILKTAIVEYVAGSIAACVKESFASEVAARRMAMDSAGKNAQQMIDDLTIEYNTARQGAITQEITEIVAGAGN